MNRSDRLPVLPAALLSASLALLLGACAPQSPENDTITIPDQPAAAEAAPPVADSAPQAPGDAEMLHECNADPVQGLVGQEATEAVVAQATADSGSASVRVLKPGQPATMDFRPDRLNILTDDAGVIEQLSCG